MTEVLYRTKVKLNTEDMAVEVDILEKESNEITVSEVFLASEIHASVKQQVALYGLSKLLQDRASDVKVGPEKIVAMQAVMTQLASGEWARERKVGAIVVSAEVEALSRVKSITVPQAQAALKGYPKEAREKILGHEKVVAMAVTIRAEREGAESVDLAELLGDDAPIAEATAAQA